jgi:hypothetical protein
MNYCYLDFEFRKVSEPRLDLVSCVTYFNGDVKVWWLFKQDITPLRTYLLSLSDTVFVAFSVEAEARSFLSLDLNPTEFKWYDLYLEYKMFQNHNHELLYGQQYIDGKVMKLKPFIDQKGKSNLAAAVYKLTGTLIDSKEKDEVRNIIITGTDHDVVQSRDRILEYNKSDVRYLQDLHRQIINYARKKITLKEHRTHYMFEAQDRANFAALTAIMVARGYPINLEWAQNFSDNVPMMIDECVRDINDQFPDIKPFSFIKKTGKWRMEQSKIREWIKKQPFANTWAKTDGGENGGNKLLSLSLEAWTDHFEYRHNYPRGNFGAQMVRYLKLKQSLNGFVDKAGMESKSFWDYVGTDGRVRPYLGIYGAQSSRSQPASTGFIFLKPAFQRCIVQPTKGKMIVGVDYGSEEFLLSALCSEDKKMLDAYKSGDVYLAFGKEIGLIPQDGTKAQYKAERDLCKATVLGLSYSMTKIGLARKMSQDTGKIVTEEEAEEFVQAFSDAYPDFNDYRKNLIEDYRCFHHIKLPCGFFMWEGNPNDRSVGNMPLQGFGASIIRKAIQLCYERKIDVLFSLHDALYIECDSNDWNTVERLLVAMKDAFCFYFSGEQKKNAEVIRMEVEAWGPDLTPGKHKLSDGNIVGVENIHIDERGVEEYKIFSKYFTTSNYSNLL